MLPSFCPATVWDILTRGEVNLFMAVPTIYSKLLEALPQNADTKLVSGEWESLTCVITFIIFLLYTVTCS